MFGWMQTKGEALPPLSLCCFSFSWPQCSRCLRKSTNLLHYYGFYCSVVQRPNHSQGRCAVYCCWKRLRTALFFIRSVFQKCVCPFQTVLLWWHLFFHSQPQVFIFTQARATQEDWPAAQSCVHASLPQRSNHTDAPPSHLRPPFHYGSQEKSGVKILHFYFKIQIMNQAYKYIAYIPVTKDWYCPLIKEGF